MHFVPLEEVSTADQIPAAVAATLGAAPRGHESAYPLSALPLPRDGRYDAQNEAIRLFLDRARRGSVERVVRCPREPHAYAEERLAADEALHLAFQRRHAGWYLDRARAWDAGFYDAHQAKAQASFERERENVAVAERWALRHDPDLARDLVDARWRYWRFAGRFAWGRTRALAAVEVGRSVDPARRARALHVAAEPARAPRNRNAAAYASGA